jgi:hypothetical protein
MFFALHFVLCLEKQPTNFSATKSSRKGLLKMIEATFGAVLPDMVSVDLLKTINLRKDVESLFKFGALMDRIHKQHWFCYTC